MISSESHAPVAVAQLETLGCMTTPQQFLESLFREQVAIYAEANVRLEPIYAKYFGEPLSRHTRHFLLMERVVESVDDVQESTGAAIIITGIRRERWPNVALRKRYHLVVVGQNWKIIRIDNECLYCHGTGRLESEICQRCDGEGWRDTIKDAA